MRYYIYKNDQRSGPFDEDHITEQLRSGELTPSDLGCAQGMKDWEPLAVLFPVAVPDHEKASISGIPTHLVGSLISLVFCLIPGIVAVVYAFETRNAKKRFDTEKAEASERKAKAWVIAAYVIGTLGIIVRLIGSR